MTRRIRCRTIDRSVFKPARSKDAKPQMTAPRARQDINERNRKFWAQQSVLDAGAGAGEATQTADSTSRADDINERHRRFWAKHKA
ncbi:hypothetical protein ACFSHT_24075 [Paraburkholderia silviterrae]|uniref:Uncharacterized protein n=1 Tax=Paraburkholderia silviterrae TaxID=2528715 RepID=A0A4R5MB65_9BURK|nr:hypothetical protein [Paraburkholderia silviterrae]TDG24037.1 hypothetical protein EYW47_11025 [Paraburkholderia silviterrae]